MSEETITIKVKSIIMDKFNFKAIMASMVVMAVLCSSCQAIESIFKAGVWVGVIIVVVIIALIFWLINKAKK